MNDFKRGRDDNDDDEQRSMPHKMNEFEEDDDDNYNDDTSKNDDIAKHLPSIIQIIFRDDDHDINTVVEFNGIQYTDLLQNIQNRFMTFYPLEFVERIRYKILDEFIWVTRENTIIKSYYTNDIRNEYQTNQLNIYENFINNLTHTSTESNFIINILLTLDYLMKNIDRFMEDRNLCDINNISFVDLIEYAVEVPIGTKRFLGINLRIMKSVDSRYGFKYQFSAITSDTNDFYTLMPF